MHWSDIIVIVAVLIGVFGGCFFVAGFLSFNTIAGERSDTDGRLLFDKMYHGSWQEQQEVRMEVRRRRSETWAKQPVTRYLIYSGSALLAVAAFLLYVAHLLAAA